MTTNGETGGSGGQLKLHGKNARQERQDGGKTGPVERRDLLIQEADQQLKGVLKAPIDNNLLEAQKEVEAILKEEQVKNA